MAGHKDDCIFCKILNGTIPAKKLAESDDAIAIADISPQATEHLLVFPKKHITSLNDLSAADRQHILPALFKLADEIAVERGFKTRGYRTVINNQTAAGQTVFHLHMHVLSAEKLKGSFGA